MLIRLAMMVASVGCRLLYERSTEVAVFSSSIGSSAQFSFSLFKHPGLGLSLAATGRGPPYLLSCGPASAARRRGRMEPWLPACPAVGAQSCPQRRLASAGAAFR